VKHDTDVKHGIIYDLRCGFELIPPNISKNPFRAIRYFIDSEQVSAGTTVETHTV